MNKQAARTTFQLVVFANHLHRISLGKHSPSIEGAEGGRRCSSVSRVWGHINEPALHLSCVLHWPACLNVALRTRNESQDDDTPRSTNLISNKHSANNALEHSRLHVQWLVFGRALVSHHWADCCRACFAASGAFVSSVGSALLLLCC